MKHDRLYQLTSIGRPLDPAWPTNKAVMIILPVVLLAGIALRLWLTGMGAGPAAMSGLMLALIAFVGWALARELAPDDQASAFIAMAVATIAGWRNPQAGVLIVFATMALVRIVNRSTGLPARLGDSLAVLALTFVVVYTTDSPFFALAAAVAFALDGGLRDPVRRHWLFALVCVIGMVVYMVDHDVTFDMLTAPDTLAEWMSVLFLVLFVFYLLRLPAPASSGDIDGKPLSHRRVRGGGLVALLAAAQGLGTLQDVVIVTSVIAGICIGSVFRKAFSHPTPARESIETIENNDEGVNS